MDNTLTVTANGQTVQANADDSFRIPNVPAVDVFPLDFVGDIPLRITGQRTVNGRTEYLFTDYFTIRQGETVIVPDVFVTDSPPRMPESLAIEVLGERVLQVVGAKTQLKALASFDGEAEPEDVTAQKARTIYRSSNRAIATVSEEGEVASLGCGVALITALNEGVTAVTTITVSEGDLLTMAEGRVVDALGVPVLGALVSTTFGFTATTDGEGYFGIEGLPSLRGLIFVYLFTAIHQLGPSRESG